MDHFNSGSAAFDQEDYVTAEKEFARAEWYAETPDFGKSPACIQAKAAALYNGALSVGHQGRFEEAERLLYQTIALDSKTDSTNTALPAGRLFELARLHQAMGKNGLARKEYEQGIPIAEKFDLEKRDPIALAIILEDYAKLLDLPADRRAESFRERAKDIRADHPGESSKTKIQYYP